MKFLYEASLTPWNGGWEAEMCIRDRHNIPEGMAVAVPLISGGTGRVRATLLTACLLYTSRCV